MSQYSEVSRLKGLGYNLRIQMVHAALKNANQMMQAFREADQSFLTNYKGTKRGDNRKSAEGSEELLELVADNFNHCRYQLKLMKFYLKVVHKKCDFITEQILWLL